MHGDVQTRDVEGLKEDLRSRLAVLRGIERWLGLQNHGQSCPKHSNFIIMATDQQEIVVFGLSLHVLEDALLPVSLHVVPVLDLAMADGVVDAIARGLSVGECFIAYEEVEVLDAAFRRKMSGFGWECWACATRLRSRSTSGYRGREYATMGVKTQAVGGSIGALTMTDRNCRRT